MAARDRPVHGARVGGRGGLSERGAGRVLGAEARGFAACLAGAGRAWAPAPLDRAARRAARSALSRAAVLVAYTVLVAVLVYTVVTR